VVGIARSLGIILPAILLGLDLCSSQHPHSNQGVDILLNHGSQFPCISLTSSRQENMSTNHSPPKKLGLGVCGLGRMGKQHALNALHSAPRVDLLAACSPTDAEMSWAEEHLVPHGVQIYRSLDEMLETTPIDALLVASATKVHYEQVMAGLSKRVHVLCEKPLAMNLEQGRKILEATKLPENADLKVMTAFSRRFDASYMEAKKAIENGQIGKPVVIRCDNRDLYDSSEAMANYLRSNPGIFIDTAVHDIDLSLSFLGEDILPKSCYAVGSIAMHKSLEVINDVDNGIGIVEWYAKNEGEAAPISYYYCSRIMQHGFDNPTEIVGTKGVLKINQHPRSNLIDIADKNGIRNEVMPDYYGRYERAFVNELNTFTACVLDGQPLPYQLSSAVKGMEIAQALQKSLVTREKICFPRQ
jgi:myo-inositol 2-dehydrogenase/D-chiro-inositol 1-dehydrogenase